MEAPPSAHPTEDSLRSYGLGKLDDGAAREVEAHLESCGDCRGRLAGLGPDSFLGRLRESARPAGSGNSPLDGTISLAAATGPAPPPPADSLPPGLADHADYEIRRELGRGGMGVVYLAHNTMMGRDEVLKVISRQIMERPSALERFLREIRAVAKLRHPNIVTAYTAFRIDGGLVFAMEHVEGLDLSRLVKAKGPLPVAHAAYFAHQAALGLQHAHERGMVHRDIKPHNLMLTHDGKARVVKILDFGLAKATREEKAETGLTSQGQALGTPDYIAPEQILDAASSDIRADLYSLGATLFYLLTARPPFQATSLYDLYQAHISRDADPLNLIRPEVPAELAALVAKLMAKDPARRFQTPGEAAEALKPFFKPRATRPDREESRAEVTIDGGKSTGPGVGARVEAAIEEASGPTPGGPGREVAGSSREVGGPAVGSSRRRPRISRAAAVAASMLALSVITGVIVIVIRGGDRETRITLPDDRPIKVVHDGVTVTSLPAGATAADDPNPWPDALASGGLTFPFEGELFAISRDGRAIGLKTSGKTARVFRSPDRAGHEIGHPESIECAAFSPDGEVLATGGEKDGTVRFWDVAAGVESRQFRRAGRFLGSPFSPDGRLLATIGGHQVRMLSATTGDLKGTLKAGHVNKYIWALAFSPDGRRLATGGGGWKEDDRPAGELRVRDVLDDSGFDLVGHAKRVTDVAFGPDGRLLASASLDGTARVWDPAARACVATFERRGKPVLGVRFGPDGRLVASFARGDRAVRVWEAETGREVAALEGLAGQAAFVEFSPGGRWIFAGSGRTLKSWPAPPGPSGPPGAMTPDLAGPPEARPAGPPPAVAADRMPRSAQAPSPAAPAPASASSAITNSAGMKLALIPAGRFQMGAAEGRGTTAERPQHAVTISRPFYLAETEVTQAQYRGVTGRTPDHFQESESLPAGGISWFEAVEFCNKLSEREKRPRYYSIDEGKKGQAVSVAEPDGDGYRLPTEAEWEYACRAGSRALYSFGDDAAELGRHAWYSTNSDRETHPVGRKLPNAFGLHDMHGNLWEWCWDWFDEGYYRERAGDDPGGPDSGTGKALRGGARDMAAPGLRTSFRTSRTPETRQSYIGFRPALNVPASEPARPAPLTDAVDRMFQPGAVWVGVTTWESAPIAGEVWPQTMTITERSGGQFKAKGTAIHLGNGVYDGSKGQGATGTIRGNRIEWTHPTANGPRASEGTVEGREFRFRFRGTADDAVGHGLLVYQGPLEPRAGAGEAAEGAERLKLIGKWDHLISGERSTMELMANGMLRRGELNGTWTSEGDRLTFRWPTNANPQQAYITKLRVNPERTTYNGEGSRGESASGRKIGGASMEGMPKVNYPLAARRGEEKRAPAPAEQETPADRQARVRAGTWRVEGDELVQAGGSGTILLGGDLPPADYDLRFRGRVDSGKEGFIAITHFSDGRNYRFFHIGELGGSTVVAGAVRQGKEGGGEPLPVETARGRWYEVLVQVRGGECRYSLDGKELHRAVDDRFRSARGVGLATWSANARFRDILVTAPDGKVLWKGPPELPK